MDEIVARLAQWLRKNHPHADKLTPGATDAAISEVEKQLGVSFPAGLRALFRFCGGGSGIAIMNNRQLLALAELPRIRAMMAGFVDDGTFARRDFWHKPWVPFLDNGGGSYLVWDPAGSFSRVGGAPGQVLEFWNRDHDRDILAPSFDEWLTAFADSLDKGIWRFDTEHQNIDDEPAFKQFLARRFSGYPRRPISVEGQPLHPKPLPPRTKVVAADLSRPVHAYRINEKYAVGDRIDHPKLGEGVVEFTSEPGKMTVRFGTERKVLVHGRSPGK